MVKSLYFGCFQSIGDIVITTAIVRETKKRYPEAKITYAVGEEALPVLISNPDIDEIIPCKSPYEIVLRSKEKEYDKIYLPLQLTSEDSLWHQRPPYCVDDGLKNHNLVDFYASRCLDDLEITDRRTFLYSNDEEWEALVQSAGESAELFRNTPYVTIHTTTRNVNKDWPYEKFLELCHKLLQKYGQKCMIFQIGGENDKPLPEPVKNLRGIPLRLSMALIKHSKLNIGLDSGTEHISDAFGVPTICIMGASASYNSGPIGPNVTFVEPYRRCIGTATHCACINPNCMINDPCVKQVSVDDVFAIASEKLDIILGV